MAAATVAVTGSVGGMLMSAVVAIPLVVAVLQVVGHSANRMANDLS